MSVVSPIPKDNATTAMGLLTLGWAYLRAAEQLFVSREHWANGTTPNEPIEFLIAHSMELLLKALLRHEGLTVDELSKRELGHQLANLRRKVKAPLPVDQNDPTFVALAARHGGENFPTRYCRTDARHLPPIPHQQKCFDLARELMNAIEPLVDPIRVQSVGPTTRRYPSPVTAEITLGLTLDEAAEQIGAFLEQQSLPSPLAGEGAGMGGTAGTDARPPQ